MTQGETKSARTPVSAAAASEKAARTQERAILALLAHARLEIAAREAGISRSTLCRLLQERAFLDALREARRQVFEAAMSRLQAEVGDAIAALHRNLTCRKPSVEVQAARTVIVEGRGSVEFFDLEDRVRQLEGAIKMREGRRR